MIKGIVFDLDDTLYFERDYVKSGFHCIAKHLETVANIPEAESFSYLWGLFEKGIRGTIFDRCLTFFPVLEKLVSVPELVELYRNHTPKIEMTGSAQEVIICLRHKGYWLGIISDGFLSGQQAKVQALGVEEWFTPIILTDIWGKEYWKPHPKSYKMTMDAWKLKPQELIYIGDNPEKDFLTPNRLGWTTVRLKTEGQLNYFIKPAALEYASKVTIKDLIHLVDMVS